MAQTTPRASLPYPSGGDSFNIPGDMGALATKVASLLGAPTFTTQQRDALAGANIYAGMVIWNSTAERVEIFRGDPAAPVPSGWQGVLSSAGGTFTGPVELPAGEAGTPALKVGAAGPGLWSTSMGILVVETDDATPLLALADDRLDPGGASRDGLADLGRTSARWRDLHLSRHARVGGNIYVDNGVIDLDDKGMGEFLPVSMYRTVAGTRRRFRVGVSQADSLPVGDVALLSDAGVDLARVQWRAGELRLLGGTDLLVTSGATVSGLLAVDGFAEFRNMVTFGSPRRARTQTSTNENWFSIDAANATGVGTSRIVMWNQDAPTPNRILVYGSQFRTLVGVAVQIDGNFNVSGTKNALIPDPDDPDLGYRYGADESNTPGRLTHPFDVTVDETGVATIDIADHLVRLVDKLRVRGPWAQGHPGVAYAGIEGNTLTVTGDPGDYYVEATGNRADPKAEGWTHLANLRDEPGTEPGEPDPEPEPEEQTEPEEQS